MLCVVYAFYSQLSLYELDDSKQVPFLLWISGPSEHEDVDYISDFQMEFLWELTVLSRGHMALSEGKEEQN